MTGSSDRRRLALVAALVVVTVAAGVSAVSPTSADGPGVDRGPAGFDPATTVTTATTPNGTPTATAVENRTVTLSLEAENATVTAGENVTLAATLRNEGATVAVAPVVELSGLPPDWQVRAQAAGNATFRESSREWLWLTLPAGESVTVSVTLAVPEDAEGRYDLRWTAADTDDNAARAAAGVSVERPASSGDDGILLPLLAGVALLGLGAIGVRLLGDGGDSGRPPETPPRHDASASDHPTDVTAEDGSGDVGATTDGETGTEPDDPAGR